jgi:putative two-component system response regulator
MQIQATKQTILVVDDTPENITILNSILRSHYKVKAALSGEKALGIAQSESPPDIILLDIMMPEMDGYDVCRKLKNNPVTEKIPIIFVTAMSEIEDEKKGLDMGAVDYITKPISPAIVLARVQTHLALYNQTRELERKVQERTSELNHTRMEIIQRLGRAAEYKDNETGLHVIRMSHYTRLIAMAINANEEWVDRIYHAAPMHDIGKIGIPDAYLLKQGPLNDTEWQVMSKHPEFGAAILGDNASELLQMAKEIALNHHEKWDGSGYPNGLKGEEIPLSARIIAIADVFDALTTARPYKQAWTVEKTVDFIDQNAGLHFDPNLVSIFHRTLPEILKVKEEYAEQLNNSMNI